MAAKSAVAMTPNTVPGTYRFQARHTWTHPSVGSNHNKMNGVRKITIHHTGEHPGLEGLSDREVIRRVESYHRNERKWAAIGYHFIIGKDGTVYEGRPATIQGAHVSRNNPHNLGVSVMGDFQRKLPTQAQLQSLTALPANSAVVTRFRRGISTAIATWAKAFAQAIDCTLGCKRINRNSLAKI